MIDTETTLEGLKTEIKANDGKLYIKREQDVEPILEWNKKELAEAPSWRPYAGRSNLRKVASIPLVLAEKWLKEEGLDIIGPASNTPEMRRRLAQKLNSNEYRDLRTYPGRVGYRS